ncbi:MAG: hypothetical protein K6U79_02090 [Firmicutes bacterium]|nr:hypothetical protein [Bacillota bacterium]
MRTAILLATPWRRRPPRNGEGGRRRLARWALVLLFLVVPRLGWGSARWQPVGEMEMVQALPSPPDGLLLRAAGAEGNPSGPVLQLQAWAFGALPPLVRTVAAGSVPGGSLLAAGLAPAVRDGAGAAQGGPLLLSPDGSEAVRVAPDTSLWLIRSDALAPRLLVGPGRAGGPQGGVVWAAEPVWSRDGKQVYFLSNRDQGGAAYGIWSVDVRTGHERRLLRPQGRESFYLAGWNDRGELLVGTSRGRLMALSGSGRLRLLMSGVQVVAVSPDGRHLLYRRLSSGGLLPDLWGADGEGRNPVRLAGPGIPEPVVPGSWSPGGSRIAYVGYAGAPSGRTALVVLDVAARRPSPGSVRLFTPPVPGLRLDLAQLPVWLDRDRLVVGTLDARKRPSTWLVRVW